jgi:hypothetical protein
MTPISLWSSLLGRRWYAVEAMRTLGQWGDPIDMGQSHNRHRTPL